jgi:hypothetical protein
MKIAYIYGYMTALLVFTREIDVRYPAATVVTHKINYRKIEQSAAPQTV